MAICCRNIALVALIVRAIRDLCGHTSCPKTIASQMGKEIIWPVLVDMQSAVFYNNNFTTVDADHAIIIPLRPYEHMCLSQNTGCNRARNQTQD